MAPRITLNRELSGFGGTHEVMVIATDPDGVASAPKPVTITIKDVNEAPMVSGGPTKSERAEGDAAADEVGIQPPVGTYTATDIELTNAACTNLGCAWSLEGPDAADFTFGDTEATFGQLSFKNAPDFENPADADMDNVYEVTVKVTDNGVDNKNKMSATRDVMITVTNADDPGKITLSSVQPKVGIEFKATLTDDDGGVEDEKVKWQWASAGRHPDVCASAPI